MKEFYTISKNETAEIIEKKSKFIADIYPVKNVEEAEKALIKAQEIAEKIQSYFPDTSIESLAKSVQTYKDIEAWKENPILKEEAFDKLQEIMTMAGELTQKAPYEKIVNNSYAEKVTK